MRKALNALIRTTSRGIVTCPEHCRSLAPSYEKKQYGGHPTIVEVGITNTNVFRNLSTAELYEFALMEDTNWTNDPNSGPAMLAENGALTAFSSTETGRSPKERRIMMTEETKDNVFWGDVNIPMDPESVYLNRQRCIDYLNGLKRLYIVDGFLGFDKDWRMKVRVFIELPYHALFMKNMLVRPTSAEEFAEFEKGVDFTIFNGGMFRADPQVKGVKNKVSVNMNFQDKEQIVLGSLYAGEMKKGMFGVMNYYMPLKGQLSMHCSANEGVKGDTTIFFGLSGTGKTTLSADPTRALIGDDEHVWTETGIFNIEGGCYAKCCFLSREKEPEIYDALKFGTVLENIRFYDFNERSINYDDVSITENTRASYPLEHIAGAKIPAIGTHPSNIIFLTCDAYGILPPVAKLTPDQAMYHFITGYTAKVAGTEVGIKEPVPSFSACFGEAFIPLHPYKYAELLAKKMQKYGTDVWLVNSGWSGGSYPEGARMDLKITRALIDAIHTGELTGTEMEKMDVFGLSIPKKVTGVDPNVLNPKNTWSDKAKYQKTLELLGGKFIKNFERYAKDTPEYVIKAGPVL